MSANNIAPAIPTIPRLAIPALSLAAFGSTISLRATDPLLPWLSQEFGVSIGEVAYVVTAFAIAYGVSQLFFAPVDDRFGKYFVVACTSLGYAFTALLCALAQNYLLLIGARLMAGATATAILPLSMVWIGDVVPYADLQPVLVQFLIGGRSSAFPLACCWVGWWLTITAGSCHSSVLLRTSSWSPPRCSL